VGFGATLLSRNLDRYKTMDRAIAMYNPGDRRYLSKVKTAKAQIRRERLLADFSNNRPLELAAE
jgi:hypothetical protein